MMTKHLHAANLILCALTAVLAAVFLVSGCATGPASASFASVVIPGKTPDQICQATAAVFQEDGYTVGSLNPSEMVFQKEGSKSQAVAYGGVVDTYYGATTAVRVRASVVDVGGGSHRLQCQAYMIRNANDAFFQDETPLLNIRSGPYRALLNKVAKRLK